MLSFLVGVLMMSAVNADFILESTDFKHEDQMPSEFTCEGDDISPMLSWSGFPKETKSFALIMDDPDAPSPDAPNRHTWDHWLVYNIPVHVTSFQKDIGEELPSGAIHGKNSWNRNDYGGPCPPKGNHRYYFRLYALDATIQLRPGASKKELFRAMEGHILATAELLGMYEKSK